MESHKDYVNYNSKSSNQVNYNVDRNYKQLYNKYKQKYLNLKQSINAQTGGYNEINQEKPQLMLFKAEWCGHCRNFKESWEALKEHVPQVDFITYDADSNEEKMKEYGVQSFPTLMLKKNDEILEFNQERNIDNIVKFVNENLN